MNVRLKIEYDGEDYFGWQVQGNLPTVQGFIIDCLTRVTGEKIVLYGASRTDRGVHARGQVASFTTRAKIEAHRYREILNQRLPKTIRILLSEETFENFHAQKSAIGKEYQYLVLNRSYCSALNRRAYHCPFPVDWTKVRESLGHFVGEKDFASFQASTGTVKTTVRTIERFDLIEEPDGYYRFLVKGNGFLKQMVRTMVGTALETGHGVRNANEIPQLFERFDRNEAGRVLPAEGLTLNKVFYADGF